MSKTKKLSKVLALVLMLALVLSITALADWTQYQKDGYHNGVIPASEAPYITNLSNGTVGTTHMGTIQLGSGGWSGIDSEALMLTEGTKTYAYVTYNGGTPTSTIGTDGGTRLAKIDVTHMNGNNVDPSIAWDIQLTQAANFQLSTPCYFNENIYVAGSGLSQLLQNNELTKSGSNYPHWTVTGSGTKYNGYFRMTGNVSATFTSDLTSLTSGYNHRPAMGIKLGTVAPTSTTATITVKAITSSNVSTTLGTYTFSPTAKSSTFTPILGDDGYYYYYLNENVDSTINNGLTAGSYKIKFEITLTGNAGNSVDVEYCSFYEQNTTLFEISSITGTSAPSSDAITTIGTNGGQINTPITAYTYTSGSTTYPCIYFGTYNGTKSYYQYNVNTGTLKTYSPSFTTTGYYWAGAYSEGNKVAFGSDNGYLCYTTVTGFGTTKKAYSLNTLGGITDAGNVRSSLCKYGDYVYFTSQGGTGTSYLWKVYWPHINSLDNPVSGDVSVIQLSGNSSTSTPVVSDNGYIYVGTYGSGTYSNNGVRAVPVNSFNSSSVISVVSGSSVSGENCVVQCSVIVCSPDNTADYVFYTTNQSGGRGHCVKHTISGHVMTNLWNTGSGNYTLQGMSSANGYLTFGNDGHIFYVIKP